uniref:Uncharacterized protein n=1 Tax=Oryza sativa subsp. japonica TaxID=39947 RepID=Q6Z486_ORYSJ|nr:hypothetical protein [Oryza sativa Japonica Group]
MPPPEVFRACYERLWTLAGQKGDNGVGDWPIGAYGEGFGRSKDERGGGTEGRATSGERDVEDAGRPVDATPSTADSGEALLPPAHPLLPLLSTAELAIASAVSLHLSRRRCPCSATGRLTPHRACSREGEKRREKEKKERWI